MNDLTAEFYLNLGQRLREVRLKAGLHQSAVARAMGFTPKAGQVFISRLEHGKAAIVTLGAFVRYLQACKAPVGEFMLELAQSGVFGEAEAESVIGFTSQKQRSPQAPHHMGFAPDDGRSGATRACLPVTPLGRTQGETSNEAKRAKVKLLRDKRWLREAQDADNIAKLWLEVLAAMQPLLPPDPTRFMAHYLEVVRGFYRAWKLATRGVLNRDPTLDVQMAFDRIEQNAVEHLVPAAVRKMREVVYERLMAMTPRGGNI